MRRNRIAFYSVFNFLFGLLCITCTLPAFADGGHSPYDPKVVYHEGSTFSALPKDWVGPRRLLEGKVANASADGNEGVAAIMGAVSSNGRWVAFASSHKLVDGAVEGMLNVYIMDALPGDIPGVSEPSGPPCCIELVSVANDYTESTKCVSWHEPRVADPSNGASYAPSVSSDGRFVAFVSKATNLVWHTDCATGDVVIAPSAPDGTEQVYVRDRQLKTTTLVSAVLDPATGIRIASEGGSHTPTISANGHYVAYASSAIGLMTMGRKNALPTSEVYLARISDLATARLSSYQVGGLEYEPLGSSSEPAINADGKCVAFTTNVTHSSIDVNNTFDVVVYESKLDAAGEPLLGQRASLKYVSIDTEMLHTGNAESGAPSISADCRRVAYMSRASNLVNTAVEAADTNGKTDIFVRDLQSQSQRRVSLGAANWFWGVLPLYLDVPWRELQQASFKPVISGNGKHILFNTTDGYVQWDETEAFYRSEVKLPGSIDSCYMALFHWDMTTWPPHETDSPSPPVGTHIPLPADWRTPVDVIKQRCLPPVAPDNNGAADVFLVDLDDATIEPQNISPVSLTGWRYGFSSYQQIDRRNLYKPADSEYFVQQIDYARHGFFQAEFGDAFSVVNSLQAISYDGQSMVFDSAASNLQEAEVAQADAINAANNMGWGLDPPLTGYGVACDQYPSTYPDGTPRPPGATIDCHWMFEDQNNELDVYYFSPTNRYVYPLGTVVERRPPWATL